MNQLSFLNIEKPKPDGQVLRDRGIRKAIQHAEEVGDGWQTKALDFLYIYAKKNPGKFSGEMVRLEAKGIVPDPPCLRAWGAILLTGSRRSWIHQVGYIKVNNPAAHRANAALWQSLICP